MPPRTEWLSVGVTWLAFGISRFGALPPALVRRGANYVIRYDNCGNLTPNFPSQTVPQLAAQNRLLSAIEAPPGLAKTTLSIAICGKFVAANAVGAVPQFSAEK